MLFSLSAILAFFFTFFLVGQVAASPLPMPMEAIEGNLKRQSPSVQTPSKSDGSAIVPYPKRQTPSVQTPSKSDGGAVVSYPKRQTPSVQTPSKSDGTAVVPYDKRYGGEIPSQLAARSVDGVIELY